MAGSQQRPYGNKTEQTGYLSIRVLEKKGDIENWIRNGVDKSTVEFANQFGRQLAESGLTNSQIRNTFGEMRRIQLKSYAAEKTSFILLKPKLAYAVKRHKNIRGLEDFYKFFEIGYDAVNGSDDQKGTLHFNNLMNLLEAVLAYHKYHGGKES